MKTSIALSLLGVMLLFGCQRQVDYPLFTSLQDPSVPEIDLAEFANQRVLMVFPHADDEIIAAGLTQGLIQQGCEIHLLTLGRGAQAEEVAIRKAELECSVSKQGIHQLYNPGFPTNTWDAVMADEIQFWYEERDSIKATIQAKISAFQPQVMITYDSEIGGYGHPEHRIPAEIAEELLAEYQADSTFSVETIFQITLPDPLEKELVGGKPGYANALERTGSKGLPTPDVAVDIRAHWPVKDAAAHCHVSQTDVLEKFYMRVEKGEMEKHKAAFPREYYRLLRKGLLNN